MGPDDRVVRRLWRAEQLYQQGWTDHALRRDVGLGVVHRVARNVYVVGPPASRLERSIAAAMAADAVVSDRVAAALLGFDGFRRLPGAPGVAIAGPEMIVAPSGNGRRPGVRRTRLHPDEVVAMHGVRCTAPARTLADLAAHLTPDQWERALESVLRGGTGPDAVAAALAAMPGRRARGRDVVASVLAVRPLDLPPTGSLMETMFVQLVRELPGVPPPLRQVEIHTADGAFIARVDLAWPDLGVFVELDGAQHAGQPMYDADRQTRVAGATGWLCGRFRWEHVTRNRRVTARRVLALLEQAQRRPLAA